VVNLPAAPAFVACLPQLETYRPVAGRLALPSLLPIVASEHATCMNSQWVLPVRLNRIRLFALVLQHRQVWRSNLGLDRGNNPWLIAPK
jgi:hypothetical protein